MRNSQVFLSVHPDKSAVKFSLVLIHSRRFALFAGVTLKETRKESLSGEFVMPDL